MIRSGCLQNSDCTLKKFLWKNCSSVRICLAFVKTTRKESFKLNILWLVLLYNLLTQASYCRLRSKLSCAYLPCTHLCVYSKQHFFLILFTIEQVDLAVIKSEALSDFTLLLIFAAPIFLLFV